MEYLKYYRRHIVNYCNLMNLCVMLRYWTTNNNIFLLNANLWLNGENGDLSGYKKITIFCSSTFSKSPMQVELQSMSVDFKVLEWLLFNSLSWSTFAIVMIDWFDGTLIRPPRDQTNMIFFLLRLLYWI